MLRYRSNNAFSCPMVIRTAIGGYLRGGAPYHSQSGESIFAHCPGIRIAFPSNAQDAAGLLRTAIRCDDPVLFLEHKHLYRQTYNKGEYPGQRLHGAVRQGAPSAAKAPTSSCSTWGALVQRSLLAAQQAEKDGISVMVVDLRTIMPFDWDAIAAAVQKTNRVVDRARGSADLRLRRRARRADRRRAVRVPRRAGAPRRRARHAGRLLPRPRGSHPPAVGGRAEGHPGHRAVLAPSRRSADAYEAVSASCSVRGALGDPLCSLRPSAPRDRASRSCDPPAAFPRTSPARSATRSDSSRPTAAQYFVFDRRAHAVYAIDRRRRRRRSSRSAPSRARARSRPRSTSIPPTAASSSPTRRTAVARCRSSPRTAGRLGGFTLPEREMPRLMLDNDGAERHRLDPVHRPVAS